MPLTLERKEVLTSIVVSIVKSVYPICHAHGAGRARPCDGGGLLHVPAFRHQHRHQHADLAKLDWRQRDNQFDKAFDRDSTILAVVEAPTPELTGAAAAALAAEAEGRQDQFESVQPLGSGEFFEKNGLLFLPRARSPQLTGQFENAAPLIEIMAGDPSIRGLTGALETGLAGVKRGQVKLDNTARPFNLIAQTVENVLNKGNGEFLLARTHQRQAADRFREARLHRVQADARLSARSSPARMRPTRSARRPPTSISPANTGARVRLTGPVPIANEEYRDRAGRRDRQRHRHGRRRADHSLAGAAFGEDHLRRVRQSRSSAFRSPPPSD